MEDLIRSKMHEALDVEQPDGDLRSRVFRSLPAYEASRPRFRLPSFRWAPELIAIFLAVALVGGLLYARGSLGLPGSGTSPRVSTPAGPFAQVSMMTATDGWADPNWNGHPRRTTDGGAHWTDVSPPSAFVGGARSSHFLDASHAWVVDTSWTPRIRFLAHRTTNGGRNWQQGAQVTVDVVSPAALDENALGGPSLNFLDPEHGWLLFDWILQAKSPASEHFNVLYRTSDGGLHWTLVSTNSWSFIGAPLTSGCPWGGPLVFTSLTTGYMNNPDRTYEPGRTQDCSTPNQLSLHVTHDGGRTWQFQALQVIGLNTSCGYVCVVGAPDFVDPLHGFLMLAGSTLLATSDGGTTWSLRSTPGSSLDASSIAWLNASDGWAWTFTAATVPLYRTRDGGATWTRIDTNLVGQTRDGWIGALYFVDQRTGFAYRATEAGGISVLLKTIDGGVTWTDVGRFN